MDAETILMNSIREKWGEMITQVCALSSVPPAFLAALIANESAGHSAASRFELQVFEELKAVARGSYLNFGSIITSALAPYDDDGLRDLATSWGLTQIMGYHTLGKLANPRDLEQPLAALTLTVEMLAEFAQRFGLDLTADFTELFQCWNGGHPGAATYDPNYVANGHARMARWEALGSRVTHS